MSAREGERHVAVQSQGVRSPVAARRLVELGREVLAALGVRRALVSITLVTTGVSARMNRKHLAHRGATDIITFALTDTPAAQVTDMYICLDVARRHAREYGVGVREELARLVVHGLLHACGWDHPEGPERFASPMWRRQEQLLRRFWPIASKGLLPLRRAHRA